MGIFNFNITHRIIVPLNSAWLNHAQRHVLYRIARFCATLKMPRRRRGDFLTYLPKWRCRVKRALRQIPGTPHHRLTHMSCRIWCDWPLTRQRCPRRPQCFPVYPRASRPQSHAPAKMYHNSTLVPIRPCRPCRSK